MLLEYMIDGEAILGGSGGAEPRQNELYNKTSCGDKSGYFLCRRRIGAGTDNSTCPKCLPRFSAFSDQMITSFLSQTIPDPLPIPFKHLLFDEDCFQNQ